MEAVFERFTDEARRVVVTAAEQARRVGAPAIDVEHLLLGVLATPAGRAFGLDPDTLIGEPATDAPAAEGQLPFSEAAKATLEGALRVAFRRRSDAISAAHLGMAICEQDGIAGLLEGLGVDLRQLPARLADAAKAEADAGAGSGTVVRRTTETVVVAAPAPVAEEPCPECGDTGPRRHETRRIVNPDGGRGSVMARVAVCGACGTALGVG